MKHELVITKDGSHTVALANMGVTYHSLHGAIQESQHVFIEAGLNYFLDRNPQEQTRILEVGFGTGLNALLSLIVSEQKHRALHYTAIDLYPLDTDFINSLNYTTILNRPDLVETFAKMHIAEWEKEISVNSNFVLHKKKLAANQAKEGTFDLIYFDAFAPGFQPELWTEEVFKGIYSRLSGNGLLVTYCSKGSARRAMQAAGFSVEKLAGPKGKREMVRAHHSMVQLIAPSFSSLT